MTTSETQARFALRTRALCDTKLSNGAYRLFMRLDHEAWGNDGLKLRQKDIGPLIDVDERQVRRLTAELVAGRYLIVRHTMTGYVYDFYRTKMSSSETESAAGTGQKCPVEADKNVPSIIIDKKQQVTPPLPPASGGTDSSQENPEPTPKTQCPDCSGRGAVLTRVYIRGMPQQRWVGCHCPASVRFGAKAS